MNSAGADSKHFARIVANQTQQTHTHLIQSFLPLQIATAIRWLLHLRKHLTDDWLQIISGQHVRKGRHSDGQCISCQGLCSKIFAVGTSTCGISTTYHGEGRLMGAKASPTPSAKALRPNTNTGTSAPNDKPSCCSRSRPSLLPQTIQCDQRSGRVRTTAPQPAPIGRRLSIRISTQDGTPSLPATSAPHVR